MPWARALDFLLAVARRFYALPAAARPHCDYVTYADEDTTAPEDITPVQAPDEAGPQLFKIVGSGKRDDRAGIRALSPREVAAGRFPSVFSPSARRVSPASLFVNSNLRCGTLTLFLSAGRQRLPREAGLADGLELAAYYGRASQGDVTVPTNDVAEHEEGKVEEGQEQWVVVGGVTVPTEAPVSDHGLTGAPALGAYILLHSLAH